MSSTWLCTAHTRCLTPHRAEQAMAFPCQPSTVTGSDRALGITRLLICPQASQACSREPGAQSPSRQVSAQATVAQMGSAAPPPHPLAALLVGPALALLTPPGTAQVEVRPGNRSRGQAHGVTTQPPGFSSTACAPCTSTTAGHGCWGGARAGDTSHHGRERSEL